MVGASPTCYPAGPLPSSPLPWGSRWVDSKRGKHVSSCPNWAPVVDLSSLSCHVSQHSAAGSSTKQLQWALRMDLFCHPSQSNCSSSTIAPTVPLSVKWAGPRSNCEGVRCVLGLSALSPQHLSYRSPGLVLSQQPHVLCPTDSGSSGSRAPKHLT